MRWNVSFNYERFEDYVAMAVGGILLFSVLAFGATPLWAQCLFRVLIFALGIFWTIGNFLADKAVRSSKAAIPLACILSWGLCQLALNRSVYRFATWTEMLNWISYSVLFFVSLQVFSKDKRRRMLLDGIVYSASAIGAFAVIQHFTSSIGSVYWVISTASLNSFGPFVDGDHYAAFIEIVLPISILGALRRRFWAHAVLAGLLFASVIACFSRTGSFLCVLELLIVPFAASFHDSSLKFNRSVVYKTVVLVGFSALFTMVVGWDILWGRFQETDPYKYRGKIVVSALKMFRDRPEFGFGLGTFETAYPAYASFDLDRIVDHAHNDWAEWAATGGVPLVIFMLWIFGRSIAAGMRSVWGLGTVFVLLHSLIDFPMQIPAIAALVFVILGTLAASEQARNGQLRIPAKAKFISGAPPRSILVEDVRT